MYCWITNISVVEKVSALCSGEKEREEWKWSWKKSHLSRFHTWKFFLRLHKYFDKVLFVRAHLITRVTLFRIYDDRMSQPNFVSALFVFTRVESTYYINCSKHIFINFTRVHLGEFHVSQLLCRKGRGVILNSGSWRNFQQ